MPIIVQWMVITLIWEVTLEEAHMVMDIMITLGIEDLMLVEACTSS